VVLPTLLRDSARSFRWRFGGCFAADERLRRWPDEAEKELGDARANDFQVSRGGGMRKAPLRVAGDEPTTFRGRGTPVACARKLLSMRRVRSRSKVSVRRWQAS
jgi:hypothetical protein